LFTPDRQRQLLATPPRRAHGPRTGPGRARRPGRPCLAGRAGAARPPGGLPLGAGGRRGAERTARTHRRR
jgi:hypothetical protein